MIARIAAASLFVLLGATTALPAAAAGCASGAAAGGVAGHFVGSGHAVAGAAVGCAVGVHEKHKQEKAAAQQQNADGQAKQPVR